MRRSECQAAIMHPLANRPRPTVLPPPKPVLTDASDLTQTLLWAKADDAIELLTTDLTELLELADDVLIEDIEDDLLIEDIEEDDLEPPTEDIENFLLAETRPSEPSPDESQKRPRVRRSWIAMPPSNTNARSPIDRDEPTRTGPRAPMPSLPRFPLLPAAPKAKATTLPSFPLLPPEPRQTKPKAPPVRLPRFSFHHSP